MLNVTVLAYTTLCNLLCRYLPFFTAFFVQKLFFDSFFFCESGSFFKPWAHLFHPRKFENGPLEPVYFLSRHSKTSSFKHELISRKGTAVRRVKFETILKYQECLFYYLTVKTKNCNPFLISCGEVFRCSQPGSLLQR